MKYVCILNGSLKITPRNFQILLEVTSSQRLIRGRVGIRRFLNTTIFYLRKFGNVQRFMQRPFLVRQSSLHHFDALHNLQKIRLAS